VLGLDVLFGNALKHAGAREGLQARRLGIAIEQRPQQRSASPRSRVPEWRAVAKTSGISVDLGC
jgi:hypothetical protein